MLIQLNTPDAPWVDPHTVTAVTIDKEYERDTFSVDVIMSGEYSEATVAKRLTEPEAKALRDKVAEQINATLATFSVPAHDQATP